MPDDIVLIEGFPEAEDYCRLRLVSGLSPKSLEAARRGLPNTLYGVRLERGGQVVGMGRVIGDDGCFFMVVDIAVLPALQGQGLGKRIMAALDVWLSARAPASADVTLGADGDAKYLYEQFGFADTTPRTINMEYIAPR